MRLPDYLNAWWAELTINSPAANSTHVVWRIHGSRAAARFRTAVQDAAARHHLLTSRVVEREGTLYLEHSAQWAISEEPLADSICHPLARQLPNVNDVIDSLVWAPLIGGTLFRPFVIELSATDAICGFVVHHGVVDYYGSQILAAEISDQLVNEIGKSIDHGPVRLQYCDYLRATAEWLGGTEAERRLEYWRQSMRGTPATCLPEAMPVDASVIVPLHRIEFELCPALREALACAARVCQSTLALITMAGNHIALASALDQLDVTATVLVSGRDAPELLGLVGYTADCFPIRASIDPKAPFPALVRQMQQAFWLGCRHRVKWELTQHVMREVGASSIAPTFNFIIDPDPVKPTRRAHRNGSELSLERISTRRPAELGSAAFHQSHDTNLFDTGHLVYVEVKYARARHGSTAVWRFVERFSRCLAAIARNPFVSVDEVMKT